MLASESSLFLYADWGDYFHHMSSITDKGHFMNVMKRPCPTFVQIWEDEHPDKITVMSMNSGELYSEITKNCPLKLWKNRLKAVWGEETL